MCSVDIWMHGGHCGHWAVSYTQFLPCRTGGSPYQHSSGCHSWTQTSACRWRLDWARSSPSSMPLYTKDGGSVVSSIDCNSDIEWKHSNFFFKWLTIHDPWHLVHEHFGWNEIGHTNHNMIHLTFSVGNKSMQLGPLSPLTLWDQMHQVEAIGGWWQLNWGGQAHSNGWKGIDGMVSNPWLPCVCYHSIYSIPAITMSSPPLSSLLCWKPTRRKGYLQNNLG